MPTRCKIITERHKLSDLATTSLAELSTVVGFGAWKALYTDGSDVLTELALGAQHTALLSGGAAAAPAWGLITNDNIAASPTAAIAWNKLAVGTVNAAMRTGAGGYPEVVPVNATATNKFLRQVSSGAPSFEALAAGDIPALSYAPAWAGLTVGSLIYANAATTVSEITAVTAGRFLVSNGAGVVPYYPAAADLTWDETHDRLGIGTSAPATRLHVYDENALNTAVMDVLTIDRGVTGGVGAPGIGSGIVLRLENGKVGGGVMTEAARLEAVMTTVTDGAEYSEIRFKRRYNGSMETLLSIGSGIYGNSAVSICPTSGPGELAFTHDSCLSLVQEDVTGNLFLWGEESAAGVMTYWDRVNDRVGIMRDDPAYTLDVDGIINSTGDIRAGATILTYGPAIEVGQLSAGTGNRYAHLDLRGDDTYTDYGLRLIRNNTGANTTSQLVHRGTGLLTVETTEAAAIGFKTTNLTRMTITSAGLVGIGTASPPYEFSVASIADATNGFNFAPSTQTIGGRSGTDGTLSIKAEGPGDATGAGMTLYGSASVSPDAIRWFKDGMEYGRFTTAGYMGIGTAIPVSKLEVFHYDVTKNIPMLLTLTHDANGADSNLGVGMAFALSDSAGNTPQQAATIAGKWVSGTSGAENGQFTIAVTRDATIRDTAMVTNVVGGATFNLNAYGADEECQFVYRTNMVGRFIPYVTGAAGANYSIGRYDDAGAFLGSCFDISRATGRVSILNTRAYSSGYALRFHTGSSGEVAYTSSDERLKKNIKSVSSEKDVLKDLDSIDGRFFDWLEPEDTAALLDGIDKAKRRPRNVGLIAQEVEKVLPEAICYPTQRDIDEGRIYLGVDYEAVTGWLVSVCKALREEIKALKTSSTTR